MKKLRTVIALFALISATALAGSGPGSFTIGDKTFLLNGQPTTVKAAEIHYPRIPRPYWGYRSRAIIFQQPRQHLPSMPTTSHKSSSMANTWAKLTA